MALLEFETLSSGRLTLHKTSDIAMSFFSVSPMEEDIQFHHDQVEMPFIHSVESAVERKWGIRLRQQIP